MLTAAAAAATAPQRRAEDLKQRPALCVAKVNCCLVMKNSHANLTPAPDKEAEAKAETEAETVTNCASKL